MTTLKNTTTNNKNTILKETGENSHWKERRTKIMLKYSLGKGIDFWVGGEHIVSVAVVVAAVVEDANTICVALSFVYRSDMLCSLFSNVCAELCILLLPRGKTRLHGRIISLVPFNRIGLPRVYYFQEISISAHILYFFFSFGISLSSHHILSNFLSLVFRSTKHTFFRIFVHFANVA